MEFYETNSDNPVKDENRRNLETNDFKVKDSLTESSETNSLSDDECDRNASLLKFLQHNSDKNAQGTLLSKLVQRFREQPPQPKNERLNGIENFWWLSSPDISINKSRTQTSFKKSGCSSYPSDLQKNSFAKVFKDETLMTDEEETKVIQEKAEKLLHLSAAVISASKLDTGRFSEKHEKYSSDNKSESPETLNSHLGLGKNLLTNVSQRSLRPEEDILYRWRLSRRIEKAKTMERSPFLHNSLSENHSPKTLSKTGKSSAYCECLKNPSNVSHNNQFVDSQGKELMQCQDCLDMTNKKDVFSCINQQVETQNLPSQKLCVGFNEVCVTKQPCHNCVTSHSLRSCKTFHCGKFTMQQTADKPNFPLMETNESFFSTEASTQTSNRATSSDKRVSMQPSGPISEKKNSMQPSDSTAPMRKTVSTQTFCILSDKKSSKQSSDDSDFKKQSTLASNTPTNTKTLHKHTDSPLNCKTISSLSNEGSILYVKPTHKNSIQPNQSIVLSNQPKIEKCVGDGKTDRFHTNLLDPVINQVLNDRIFVMSVEDNSVKEPLLKFKSNCNENELDQIKDEERCQVKIGMNHHSATSVVIPEVEHLKLHESNLMDSLMNEVSSSESEFIDDEILIELRNRRKILKKKLSSINKTIQKDRLIA